MEQKRPKSVTWLALGVLSLIVIYLTRLVSTVQQWDFLATLPLSAPPAYLFSTGLIWSILPLQVVWGLWAGKKWAPKSVIGLTILYGLYYWMEQWLLKSNPLRTTNWLFSLVVTLMLLILVCWVLSRKAEKLYFGENNEQKSEN
jgi:hypothetical protein